MKSVTLFGSWKKAADEETKTQFQYDIKSYETSTCNGSWQSTTFQNHAMNSNKPFWQIWMLFRQMTSKRPQKQFRKYFYFGLKKYTFYLIIPHSNPPHCLIIRFSAPNCQTASNTRIWMPLSDTIKVFFQTLFFSFWKATKWSYSKTREHQILLIYDATNVLKSNWLFVYGDIIDYTQLSKHGLITYLLMGKRPGENITITIP
jgi:hypothetical protein